MYVLMLTLTIFILLFVFGRLSGKFKFSHLHFTPHWVERGKKSQDVTQYIAQRKLGDHSISVIRGDNFYSNGVDSYEVAILDNAGNLNYSTPLTNDVLGYLSKEDVERVGRKLEKLTNF